MAEKITEILKTYNLEQNDQELSERVMKIISLDFESLYTVENLKRIFSLIDLTSLNSADTSKTIEKLVQRVNQFQKHFNLPNPAAICVFPKLISVVKQNLTPKGISIASVGGAFPDSQSYIEVKNLECQMAIEQGADELDIVMSVGTFLEGDYQRIFDEISVLKKSCGNRLLKVILETGILKTAKNIKTASILALEAGADFIKTSTGKATKNASLEAAYLMTQAISEHYQKTGKMTGFKAAGGISSTRKAIEFYAISKTNFESKWLHKQYLRIGASSLANRLLSEILRLETGEEKTICYF